MTEKPMEFTVFQKNQDVTFLSYRGQMPTNFNKIFYTCRQVNYCQTSVKKFVTKLWLIDD